MPGQATDKVRRSRITAACAICRAKRQKCSGSKPVCDQCKNNNEQCWWSDQKKRGPAKDYLRSLQDRLQDTERLLLGVLGQVTDDQLFNVVQREATYPAPPPSHLKWTDSMSGQEYWSRYPFDTFGSIRDWERDRKVQEAKSNSSERASPPEPSNNMPQSTQDPLMSSSTASLANTQSMMPGSLQHHVPTMLQPQDGSEPTWLGHENGHPMPQRRYSEETHDVAKTLFSISHNSDAGRPPYQDWEPEHNDTTAPAETPTTQKLSSQFPKHLFW